MKLTGEIVCLNLKSSKLKTSIQSFLSIPIRSQSHSDAIKKFKIHFFCAKYHIYTACAQPCILEMKVASRSYMYR